jgi:hypothetical protein
MTNVENLTSSQSPSAKEPAEGSREIIEKDLERAERGGQQGGYHGENKQGAENELTSGHRAPDDGGADNVKR